MGKVAAMERRWAAEEARFFRDWRREMGADGAGADGDGAGGAGGIDFVLAADCISSDVYSADSWRQLAKTIAMLCTPGRTRAYVAAERRPGDGLDGFLALCARGGGSGGGGGGGGGEDGEEGFSMYGRAPRFSECVLVHEEERGGASFEIYRLSID